MACAVKQIADERCSRCGTPAHWAYSTDPNIEFELEDLTCHACAKIETAEEDEKERPKGTVKLAHAHGVRYKDGTEEPLPTRADFYERLQAQAQAKAKALQDSSNEVTNPIE